MKFKSLLSIFIFVAVPSLVFAAGPISVSIGGYTLPPPNSFPHGPALGTMPISPPTLHCGHPATLMIAVSNPRTKAPIWSLASIQQLIFPMEVRDRINTLDRGG